MVFQELRNRTELGYLISKQPLNDREFDPLKTSLRSLVVRKNLDKDFFLGNKSLGAMFEEAGYAAVPSPDRSPGNYLLTENSNIQLKLNYFIFVNDRILSLFCNRFITINTGDVRYYRGGFITRYHGSRYDDNDEVDAVQIEFPRQLRMGGEKVVNLLGKAVGDILVNFYNTWY